jgi:hypothetical protein
MESIVCGLVAEVLALKQQEPPPSRLKAGNVAIHIDRNLHPGDTLHIEDLDITLSS